MIWAQDNDNAIGRNGTLPWHFSSDLKNFKKLTIGSTIVMGRKTWDSLPIKPLPGRRNIVISGSKQEGVESYQSIQSCIDTLRDDNLPQIYVIGGMSIYKFFYDYADTLHITFINKKYSNTDTFFPISLAQIESDFRIQSKDDTNKELSFTTWVRK